ncbi:hypothetical protein G7K71_14070 [Desulfofundulus sp. TPOSR]|uniref:hypothetical protein n=1 Tax=Desulfofundulus sp. TPOSR TaxID=2714340 RepID=UPI00140ABFAE|nr:hypothetical protein [Desulfofundulus sp. TPOSR]NHM28085.1 hypothetical protein [Desulfofundulus sp. TPOSR]
MEEKQEKIRFLGGKMPGSGVSRVVLALTAVVWTALITAAAWVVAAAGWVLLARLWRQELFVPDAAQVTASTLALVMVWALAVFLGFRLWARYNYRRYYLRNRRRLEPVPVSAPRPGWAEVVVAAGGAVVKRSRAALLRARRGPSGLPATRLLSEAAVLVREGDRRAAAGLLRLAVSNSAADVAVRESAMRLLAASIVGLGQAGREAASRARGMRALR